MEAAVVGAVATKVVEGTVDLLLGKLLSRAKQQLHFVLHLEKEIHFLRENLPKLKEVIWSAEVRDETMEMRRAWQGFVEDAEDILDEYDMLTADQRRRSNQVAARRRSIFKKPTSKVRHLMSRLELANRIKGLYDGLELPKSDVIKSRQFVASAEEGLRLAKKEARGEVGQLSCRPNTNELLAKNFLFVGREKMKKKIMAELFSQPSSSGPTVVLVTGMGGVGKTTLAQDILCQGSIAGHFGYTKWVCVGDELDLKTVTRAILNKDRGDVMEIRSKLEGKRFLIVLDDCWSGKLKSWKDLWVPLTYGSDGSKILITSREDISSELLLASVEKYELGVLSDDECLQIFESYAFPNNGASGSSSTSRLQVNEKKILNEKIKGLPLAATVLGSSLRKVMRNQWEYMLRGVVQSDIMSVLMWSYQCLPWYLKQCFAYLSVFPKDYKLEKEHVVWMWMAHGYIQPKNNRILEDIGKDYFDDLVRASLIQKMQEYIYYNMHDLVHDLAMKVSIGGCFLYKHLSITDNKSFNKCFDNNKKLRTLLIFWKDADITKIQLQYVRVLLVSGRHFARIDFNEMRYLKYLDLTKVAFNSIISESICDIYNMQTLVLPFTRNLPNLRPLIGEGYARFPFPWGTWNLPNLRHLIGGEGYARHCRGIPMTGISNSKSLQTISSFNLFYKEDIKELANLNELRKLLIRCHHSVTSLPNALEAQLHDKAYIEELALIGFTENLIQNGILENLRPHQSLRTLEISCYSGDQLPSWISGNHLPHLVKLKLIYLYVVELPALGHLPSLEHLVINGLRRVRCIGDGFYGSGADVFPSLKVLELKEMDGLEEWKEPDRHEKDGIHTCFPSLERLDIQNCERLRSMPCHLPSHKDGIHTCFPSLERLDIQKCKRLRSMPRHLPSCLKRMIIRETELEALSEIGRGSTCTDGHPEYCCDNSPRLQELTIKYCRSLRLEEWFRRHRMPALQELRLEVVGGCTNLVINYSRKCLTHLEILSMGGLKSIRLCNMAPLDESGEAHYPSLSVQLRNLYDLEEMSMVNSKDGKITAGPLQLRAHGWYGAPMVVENLSEMMLQDQDYSLKNAVEFLCEERQVMLRVEPRFKYN